MEVVVTARLRKDCIEKLEKNIKNELISANTLLFVVMDDNAPQVDLDNSLKLTVTPLLNYRKYRFIGFSKCLVTRDCDIFPVTVSGIVEYEISNDMDVKEYKLGSQVFTSTNAGKFVLLSDKKNIELCKKLRKNVWEISNNNKDVVESINNELLSLTKSVSKESVGIIVGKRKNILKILITH